MQAAKTKRSRSSYLQELEHASSPLSARAWLGVVRERQEEWRKNHTPWRYGHHGDMVTMVMTRQIISEAVSWLFFPADLLDLALSIPWSGHSATCQPQIYCSQALMLGGHAREPGNEANPPLELIVKFCYIVLNDHHTC